MSEAPKQELDEIATLRHALNYDPTTGVFTWKNPRGRTAKVGAKAGSAKTNGYVSLNVYGKSYLAHRAAWMYVYGKVPNGSIDHVNRDRHDNRIENLRQCTTAQNLWNRVDKHSASGARETRSRTTGEVISFRAKIRHLGESYHLGTFKTKEEASAAYHKAAKQLRGEFYE